MNRFVICKNTTVGLLIFSLLLTQTAPAALQQKERVVRVAFLGLLFDSVEAELQEKITSDVLTFLTAPGTLTVLSPTDALNRLGLSRLERLPSTIEKDSLARLAAALEVDFVFVGELSNQSRDRDRMLLVGSIQRFDRATNARFVFDILATRQSLHENLMKVDEQLVRPILPPPQEPFLKRFLPVLLIGGITLIGVLLLILGSGKGGGEGTLEDPPTRG